MPSADSTGHNALDTLYTDHHGWLLAWLRRNQYEVGIKYQLPGYNALLTLSTFEITREKVLTTDPDNVNFSIQKGEVRSRGIEVEAKVNLFKSLNLTAGYSFTDAKITKSNDGDKGNRAGQVPEHLASLWAHYRIQDGILGGLGFGARRSITGGIGYRW